MCSGHQAKQEARKAQYTRWEDQPLGLELLVALGAAILAAELATRPTRLATPVLLLAVGVLLGFIPPLWDRTGSRRGTGFVERVLWNDQAVDRRWTVEPDGASRGPFHFQGSGTVQTGPARPARGREGGTSAGMPRELATANRSAT